MQSKEIKLLATGVDLNVHDGSEKRRLTQLCARIAPTAVNGFCQRGKKPFLKPRRLRQLPPPFFQIVSRLHAQPVANERIALADGVRL